MLSYRPIRLSILVRVAALSVLLFALAGCGLSLAEDVTPPPNYRPPTPAEEQPAALQTVFPIVPPDPQQGRAIYAEKCLACHGARGMGDGAQAAQLPNPAAPIGDPELARDARPVDWYQVVTLGNLERFMPGFTQSLNDRQRWDVVAYATMLSTSPEELTQGRDLYQANCASCHGASGRGDGEAAAGLRTKPTSWADQSVLPTLSQQSMVLLMQNGKGEMPAFKDRLDEGQSFAVAAYVRSLSYANPEDLLAAAEPAGQSTPVATADAQVTPSSETPAAGETSAAGATPVTPGAAAIPSKITITGQVTNASPGGALPGDMKATLLAYQEMAPAFEREAPVSADGVYSFEDVDFAENFVYFVRIDAGGMSFNSDILHARDVSGEKGELPVQIYDTTNEITALRADRLHVFFDFSTPGKVQVVNLYIISNTSGKMVVASAPGKPVIEFELPAGAENLQFQDGVLGERYVQTEKGFGDTAVVPPGEGGVNQVLFAFDLPYAGETKFDLKMPMPVEAAQVMVPQAGVNLEGSQLTDAGQRDVEGMSFHMYQAKAPLAAGENMALALKGSPGSGAAAPTSAGGTSDLLIGLGALGLVLAGAGTWLYWQRSKTAEAQEDDDVELMEDSAAMRGPDGRPASSEALLDAIVALDDQHATGGLPDAAYQERRAQLKALLAEAVAREQNAGGGQ